MHLVHFMGKVRVRSFFNIICVISRKATPLPLPPRFSKDIATTLFVGDFIIAPCLLIVDMLDLLQCLDTPLPPPTTDL